MRERNLNLLKELDDKDSELTLEEAKKAAWGMPIKCSVDRKHLAYHARKFANRFGIKVYKQDKPGDHIDTADPRAIAFHTRVLEVSEKEGVDEELVGYPWLVHPMVVILLRSFANPFRLNFAI